jgi:hypothetical protein
LLCLFWTLHISDLKKNQQAITLMSPNGYFNPQLKSIVVFSWAVVAHVCNPSYSGGRDSEDRRSDPPDPQANSCRDPVLR